MPFDWEYRLSVLSAVAHIFVLPPVVLLIATRLLHPSSGDFTFVHALGGIAAGQVLRWAASTYRTWRAAKQHGAHRPPDVKGKWPGNLDIVIWLATSKTHHPAHLSKALLDQAGSNTVSLRMLGAEMYLTADERLVKQILASSFDGFEKGEAFRLVMESFLGNGIFNRDGDVWKMHRAMTRPFFARERISDVHLIDTHTRKFINIVALRRKAGPCRGAIDLQDLFARLTMDTGSEFLFGSSPRTLDHPLPSADNAKMGVKGSDAPRVNVSGNEESRRSSEFVAAFESMLQVAEARFKGNIWQLLEFFNDRMAAHAKAGRAYIDELIRATNERRASHNAGDQDHDDGTLLDYMLANCADKELIRDELLNILLAARDTTAASLTFTIYLLSCHPEAYDRVRQEVINLCGRDGIPGFEQLRQLKYLKAVINESLRLFPPIPANIRCAKSDLAVPLNSSSDINGSSEKLFIPAGTPVMYLPILIHRRKDLWGEDAEDFKPERWLDPERVAQYTKNPFMFIPFNAGPRICLGQQFASNNLAFVVARLAQRFTRIELAEDVQPRESHPPAEWKKLDGRVAQERIAPSSAITMFIKGGLWVRFEEDESDS